EGKRVSTIDLLGREFVVLCGPEADGSKIASPAHHARIYKENTDFTTADGTWRDIYGISPRGGVLIRPDGYISARQA
ncbi:MAG: FAD-binding monooxygenase, partial [Terrimicrobiaceae bacterium]